MKKSALPGLKANKELAAQSAGDRTSMNKDDSDVGGTSKSKTNRKGEEPAIRVEDVDMPGLWPIPFLSHLLLIGE